MIDKVPMLSDVSSSLTKNIQRVSINSQNLCDFLQKAIDDLLRELSEKADWIQLVSLQASINQYLEKLKAKIQAMADVVGEPRAATVTRKLHREAECLSCATPAHMELETFKGPPSLPGFGVARPPAIGAEAEATPKEDGDHRVCYPDMPIPHAIDPRFKL